MLYTTPERPATPNWIADEIEDVQRDAIDDASERRLCLDVPTLTAWSVLGLIARSDNTVPICNVHCAEEIEQEIRDSTPPLDADRLLRGINPAFGWSPRLRHTARRLRTRAATLPPTRRAQP